MKCLNSESWAVSIADRNRTSHFRSGRWFHRDQFFVKSADCWPVCIFKTTDAGRKVAFIKDQIDNLLHRLQALIKLLVKGKIELDSLFDMDGSSSLQSLFDRIFRNKKRNTSLCQFGFNLLPISIFVQFSQFRFRIPTQKVKEVFLLVCWVAWNSCPYCRCQFMVE